MKTTLYLNGKKTTRKAMTEFIDKYRLDRMLTEAKERFVIDPLEEQSFFLGKYGMFTVEFN